MVTFYFPHARLLRASASFDRIYIYKDKAVDNTNMTTIPVYLVMFKTICCTSQNLQIVFGLSSLANICGKCNNRQHEKIITSLKALKISVYILTTTHN